MLSNPSPTQRKFISTWSIFLLASALVLCGGLPTRAADDNVTLRIGSVELQPYGSRNPGGEPGGILYDLHEELGKRIGVPFSNQLVPFARMIDMLGNGELDLIQAQPHASVLEAGEQLVVQNQINVVVVTKRGSNIRGFNGLKDRRLLHILRASYPSLDGVTDKIDYVKNYEIMLKMILNRPGIAGGVFSEPAFYYWMHQLGYSMSDFGVIIRIATRDDWIFVRRGLDQSLKAKIRSAVESLRREKYYERLMDEFKEEMMR